MSYKLPTRNLVSQDDHAMIEKPSVPRSKFTGSWTRKMTFDAGYLVPFLVEEILPGDHMSYDVTAYLRMATPLFPIFDNQRIDTFFFFVPNRIVWSNWVKFMGEQNSPADSVAYTVPQMVSGPGGFAANTIFDYMGLPVAGQITAGQTISVNALPLRAYNSIYNQWFRDENLINGLTLTTTDGPDGNIYFLQRRAKSHDYFTSALPWPQKFTAPTVPIGGSAYVRGIGFGAGLGGAAYAPVIDGTNYVEAGNLAALHAFGQVGPLTVEADIVNGWPNIRADLSTATGVSINVFRQAFLVQQMLERDARGGTRYTEIVRSHFGVTSPDMRLQRPEYIGGGSTPLVVTPIAQTATGGGGLGALGAAATATGGHRASYSATEHGHIIGLINVRSELSYSQGLRKMWTRSTRTDFYWPSLSQLGEQAILRQEIYCTGVDADDVTVFGYQERWHEYRQRVSEVAGLFRPTTAGNIDEWHLSQQFTAAPTLGQTFIEDTPPMTRVLAAGAAANNMQYLADILIRRDAVRPLPMYGTPALLGRF